MIRFCDDWFGSTLFSSVKRMRLGDVMRCVLMQHDEDERFWFSVEL